jgi:hypothetical protein
MVWATCPLCDGAVLLSRSLTLDSTLFCPRCDCLLQIVSLDPPEVDFPFRLGETRDEPKVSRRSRRLSSPK